MSFKTVVWKDVKKTIPHWGVAETGKEITLPVQLANGFIAQKQAEEVSLKKPKTHSKEVKK